MWHVNRAGVGNIPIHWCATGVYRPIAIHIKESLYGHSMVDCDWASPGNNSNDLRIVSLVAEDARFKISYLATHHQFKSDTIHQLLSMVFKWAG